MKDTMKPKDEFVVRCEKSGTITEIIKETPELRELFLPGEFCLQYVQADSLMKALDFFSGLKAQKLKANVELIFMRNQRLYTLVASGAKDGEEHVILSFTVLHEDGLVEELMKINNEQTDLYRNALKMMSLRDSNLDKTNQEIFEEISRLNNEVVNAQRELARKNRELNELNDKLEALMIRDPLTKLYNNRHLRQRFVEECKRAVRFGYSISLAMIDLNNFKVVNDTYGHATGDKTLVLFADLCMKHTREGLDIVFRVGGDEFLILFINCTKEAGIKILERLDAEFKNESKISSLAYGVVSFSGAEEEDLEARMAQADAMMYEHKKSTIKGK
jgi:diguanylate cyclase (GGDEF)-like protein